MSTNRKTQIPAIPAPGGSVIELLRTVTAMKEAVEVGLSRRGDNLDGFVTRRELVDAGMATSVGGGGIRAGGFPYGGGGQVIVDVPGGENGLPNNNPPNYGQDDFTPPPMPTNVRTQAIAPNKIMVLFDPPNYGNHAYAEIYFIREATGTTYAQFLAASPGFNPNKPCTGAVSGTNPNPWFRGRYEGSNPILELGAADNPGATSLGAALNPPKLYFFVRFVSLANVSGPFGPQGTGAMAQPSIDPVLVLDIMTRDVQAHGLYSNLRAFIGTDPNALQQIIQNGRGITAIFTDTVSHGETIDQLWTVRMERQLPDGSIVAAGFGLGITEDVPNGTARSLFAVNADKFAIMGSGTPYVPLTSYSVSGGDPKFAVLGMTNTANFQVGQAITFKHKAGTSPLENLEGVITVKTANSLTVEKSVPGFTPPSQPPPSTTWPAASATDVFVTGATNIPFIVDTLNSVVGIRGKLVVDGLIRATAGDFNSLSANTAFIASLRAGIVNANMLVGQSIIAGDGLPDGATISDIAQLDAWIVQISRVAPGGFPLRIWNPKRYTANPNGGFQILSFSAGNPISPIPDERYPNLYLNGDLRLGGNAVLNLRNGGAVGMGAKSSDGVAYTFWCGSDVDWNQPYGVMDDRGAFWIRPRLLSEPGPNNFRAGFNLDLFLGNNSLAIPSTTGNNNPGADYSITGNTIRANTLVKDVLSNNTITVRGLRNGGVASTQVTVSGLLVSSNFGTTNNGDDKMFRLTAYLQHSGGGVYLIGEIVQDDYSPECMPFAFSNTINAIPGTYRVRITLQSIEDREMSIIRNWGVVAFQAATNGALT